MKTIDLGKKSEFPESPSAEPAPESSKPKVYYPSLYLSFDGESPNFPESGKATIDFKVISKTVYDRDGKKSCSIDLEIQTITPEKSQSKKPKDSSALMDDIEEGLKKEELEK